MRPGKKRKAKNYLAKIWSGIFIYKGGAYYVASML